MRGLVGIQIDETQPQTQQVDDTAVGPMKLGLGNPGVPFRVEGGDDLGENVEAVGPLDFQHRRPVSRRGVGFGPQQGEKAAILRAVIERGFVQPGQQRGERFRVRLHEPALALECEPRGGYHGRCRSPMYSVLRLVTFRLPKLSGYGALSRSRPYRFVLPVLEFLITYP